MSDQIRVKCSGCDSTIKATAKHWGKRVKCPKCGTALEIPTPTAAVVEVEEERSKTPRQPAPARKSAGGAPAARAGGKPAAESRAPSRPRRKAAVESEARAVDFDLTDDPTEDFEDYEDYEPPRRSAELPPRRPARRPASSRRDSAKSPPKKARPKKRKKDSDDDSRGAKIGGGLLLMVVAAGWFGAGLYAGYIYFYPPVLFVLGVIGVFQGIFGGD